MCTLLSMINFPRRIPNHPRPVVVVKPPCPPKAHAMTRDECLRILLDALVIFTLLPYLHTALNEHMTPSHPSYEDCVVFQTSCVAITALLWGLTWFPEFGTRNFGGRWYSRVRRAAGVVWGGFLLMAMKPAEWFLSLGDQACYLAAGHAALGHIATAAYALILVGSVFIVHDIQRSVSNIWTQIAYIIATGLVLLGVMVGIQYVYTE